MKPLLLWCLLVVLFGLIPNNSVSAEKQFCRCRVKGEQTYYFPSKACDGEFLCYKWGAHVHCEVTDDRMLDKFKNCCKTSEVSCQVFD